MTVQSYCIEHRHDTANTDGELSQYWCIGLIHWNNFNIYTHTIKHIDDILNQLLFNTDLHIEPVHTILLFVKY